MKTKEVWASTGFTKNMGNYESVRVEIGIKKYDEDKPIDEEKAYEECAKFLEEKQTELLKEIAEGFKN